MSTKHCILMSILFLSWGVYAAEPEVPSSEEIKKVFDYYTNGDQPLLVEQLFCLEIETEGNNRFNCAEPISANEIFEYDSVYVWLSFLVPDSIESNLILQFYHNERLEKQYDFIVKSSYRYRVWKVIPTHIIKKWQAVITETNNGNEIASFTYNVKSY